MRLMVIAAAAVAFANSADAQPIKTPAEVKVVEGRFTDRAGKPLYVFTHDTMRQMSHCEGDCAQAWPPLLASKKSKPLGQFYLIRRENGDTQWAYKDKPLYTSVRDRAHGAPTAESEIWKIARP